MARNGVFMLAFALFLFTVECNVTETEVKQMDSSSGFDRKNVPPLKDGNISNGSLSKTASNLDSAKVEQGKSSIVQDGGGLEEGGKIDSKKKELSKDSGSKQNHEVEKGKGSVGKGSQMDGEIEKQVSVNAGSESKVVPKEDMKDRDSGLSKSLKRENARLEECDSSNSCVDEKNKFVACLRVPGNESPDLSLLIQNKGTGSLRVNITAPDHVQLEQTMVQLQEKENTKLMVSIGDGGHDTLIVLTDGYGGRCKLDFRDMMFPNSVKKMEYSSLSAYSSLLTRRSALYLFIAALLLIGAAWACVTFRRRHDELRYQKVETELPVSKGGKMETDVSDGWDNSWGDGWDDVEAPKTPSKPVSNLSSKGLASRRYNNKEGWQNSWKD